MSAWDHLTILLPLKDRAAFTERWLAYAAAGHLHCKILIADGGCNDDAHTIASSYQARGLRVEYVRYPHDRSYEQYFAKIADAVSRITTPYAVMADNDDLFVADGLRAAVEFLDDNPDYAACGGQCAVFWLESERLTNGDERVYGDRVDWKCSSQFSTDVASSAAQRLIERCLGANDVFYAVHRTDLMKSYFEAVRDCNPRDLFLMEQLVMFLAAIAGKTRQLDRLYIARQQDSPGSSGGAHQQRFGDWYDRMLVPTWSEDFARFVECSAAALVRADHITPEDARRVVIDSYKASVAPSLLADLVEEPTVSPTMPLVLQVVRRLVKMPATSRARRLMQRLYRRSRWLSHDVVHGTEFRTRRARQAGREFAPVAEFLTNRQVS